MQAVRTIVWVLALVALLAFSYLNWRPVEVAIWPSLVLETKIPALVVISFLLGLIPTWLVHRGVKWQMQRRISALENAARANAVSTPVQPPVAEPTPEIEPVPAVSDMPIAEPAPVVAPSTEPPEGPPRP